MGTDVMFLRSRINMNRIETRNCIISIFKDLGYLCKYYDKYDNYHKCWYDDFTSIAPEIIKESGDREGLCLSVYEKCICEDDDSFDWIGKDIDIAVIIEGVSHATKMLLEITYKYFQRYPKDLFWTDYVLYNKKEIDMIYQKSKDNSWYYRKPDYLL